MRLLPQYVKGEAAGRRSVPVEDEVLRGRNGLATDGTDLVAAEETPAARKTVKCAANRHSDGIAWPKLRLWEGDAEERAP